MRRRAFLTGLLAAIPAAGAHTPYGQWVTYRRKHLLIGCHRQDMETYALAQQVAEAFGHSLAEASTRVARAPHPQRLASLLGTDQLDLAILSVEDAIGIATGSGDFAPYGEVPLGMIAGFDTGHVFVAQSGFRADHAWLVTYAVGESSAIDPDMQPVAPLDWHEGARIFRNAGDMPDPPAVE